jgi:hypothetical protein
MVLRRSHRRALATLAAGDFVAARRELEPLALESRAASRSLGRLACLLGDYATAEALLHPRRDAATLALVHYRTGRFDNARLVRGLPLSRLMTAFDGRPYRIDWHGEREAVLPFIQRTAWELPTVEIEIDGRAVEAWIDTGGDALTLPHSFGVEPLAGFSGASYAGGRPGAGVYGRVGSVRLGPVTVDAVPVMTAGLERPVIGTSFLSRFLPTLDYPAGRLVLRSREAEPPAGVEVPFALAATHLLVVRGSLAGHELTFVVDSGLEDEQGAAFAAPASTLAAAGIPLPHTRPEHGSSGAGATTLALGRFAAPRLGIGPLVHDAGGLYGVFPPGLERAAGFPIHGLVSHGFLRRYSWTIDFTRMTMRFGR